MLVSSLRGRARARWDSKEASERIWEALGGRAGTSATQWASISMGASQLFLEQASPFLVLFPWCSVLNNLCYPLPPPTKFIC